MVPWRGCCDGKSYNPILDCCRCGKIYSRLTQVGTGVFSCYRPAYALGHNYPHAWIEVPPSFSIGFGPGSANPFGGPGMLESPEPASAEAAIHGMTSSWCKEIKVYPCVQDPQRFKDRVLWWQSTMPAFPPSHQRVPYSWYFALVHDCTTFTTWLSAKAGSESAYVSGKCEFKEVPDTWAP
jgi:hypothetical protein